MASASVASISPPTCGATSTPKPIASVAAASTLASMKARALRSHDQAREPRSRAIAISASPAR